MTINEIKTQLGISKLELRFAKDKEGNPTEWLRHWDNLKRTEIVLHQKLADKIKDNKDINLALKSVNKVAEKSGLEYTTHIIVELPDADYTF